MHIIFIAYNDALPIFHEITENNREIESSISGDRTKRYIGPFKSADDYFVNILRDRKFSSHDGPHCGRTPRLEIVKVSERRSGIRSPAAGSFCRVMDYASVSINFYFLRMYVGREQARGGGWDEKSSGLGSVIRVTRRCASSVIRVNRASKMHGNGPGATAFSGNF